MSDDNVFRFGTVNGGKQEEDKDEFPANLYIVRDIEDVEHLYEGYLIFTSQHVCIMEEGPNGPITGFMIPMIRVKDVSLYVEEDEASVN